MKILLLTIALTCCLTAQAQSANSRRQRTRYATKSIAIALGPSYLFHAQLPGTLAISFPYRVNDNAPVQFSGQRKDLFKSPYTVWNLNVRIGRDNHLFMAGVGLSNHDVSGGFGYGYRITPKPLLGGRLIIFPIINFEASAADAKLGEIDNRQSTISALGTTFHDSFSGHYNHTIDADHVSVSYHHNFTALTPGILFQLHPTRGILAIDFVLTYNVVLRDRSKLELNQYSAGGDWGYTGMAQLTNPDINATLEGRKTTHVRYPFSGPCLTIRLAIAGPKPTP